MTLTIGSMFSGTGGLDLAVEAVTGATPAWFCEWDDAPSKILAHHWPDVPNYRDVTTVDWANVPPVDIITGGSPCQDLSLAGARRGMTDGTRSNLWVAMREAIATIRPRLVVWENVRGALSATATSESDMEPGAGLLGGGTGHLRALGRVLGDLASIGYDAKWQLLRASDVGAPHHRARVFLVAYPADAGSFGLQAARRGSGSEASLPGSVGGAGALPALNHLPTPNASSRSSDRFSQPLGEVVRDESVFGKYAPAVRRWERVLGRPAPNPTELNRNGKPRLNAEFASFMMGLPPGWVTQVPGVTRAQQLKACGNGVVPQQAAAALRHLLE